MRKVLLDYFAEEELAALAGERLCFAFVFRVTLGNYFVNWQFMGGRKGESSFLKSWQRFESDFDGLYYPAATTYTTKTTYKYTAPTYMGYPTSTTPPPSYANAAGAPSRPSVSPPRAGPILQVSSRDRPRRRNSPWR